MADVSFNNIHWRMSALKTYNNNKGRIRIINDSGLLPYMPATSINDLSSDARLFNISNKKSDSSFRSHFETSRHHFDTGSKTGNLIRVGQYR